LVVLTPMKNELIEQAIFRMDENTPRIQKCLDQLSEAEVWQRPNGSSNSVGNLILHLCGNIRQYIVSSLGEVPDSRDRDAEFNGEGSMNKAALYDKINGTVEEAKTVIRQLQEEDMLRQRSVQGFSFSAVGIILHVMEHYSYHTGQIAFWTKLLKDRDLGFYADFDLNTKNEL